MGYQIYDSNQNKYVNIEDHTYCAKNSSIKSGLRFNPKTYYANDFAGFENSDQFIRTGTGIFSGKWGHIPLVSTDKFTDASNKALLFADARSCPVPYKSSDTKPEETWGNVRIAGSSELSNVVLEPGDPYISLQCWDYYANGYWVPSSYSNHSSPIVFLEITGAGGGAAKSGATNGSTYVAAGGGGGGGAYCSVVLDLTITGRVIITLATSASTGSNGGSSTITFTPSGGTTIKLTCGGGKAGSNGGTWDGGAGGAGGTFSASGLPNFDSYASRNCENLAVYKDSGILAINWYNGKAGGRGGFRNLVSRYDGSDGGCFTSTDKILYPDEFAISPIYLATGYYRKLGYSRGGDITIETSNLGWVAGEAGGGASAISHQINVDSCEGFGSGGFSLPWYTKGGNSVNNMGIGNAGGLILH